MSPAPLEPDEYLRVVRDNIDKWARVAARALDKGPELEDSSTIQDVFKTWAALAQRALPSVVKADQLLHWLVIALPFGKDCSDMVRKTDNRSVYQLRLQVRLLDTLFTILVYNPDRPPYVTHGLVKGMVLSNFGTKQANRDLWRGNEPAEQLSRRIRDLTLVISLESLCLWRIADGTASQGVPTDAPISSSVQTRDKADTLAEEEQEEPWTILSSEQDLFDLNGFLLQQSADLARTSEPNEDGFDPEQIPVVPMPVLCLAWAIVMNALPDYLRFPTPGLQPMHQEFAARALSLQSGLFFWLEELLIGPLFIRKADDDDDNASQNELSRRKVVKGGFGRRRRSWLY